MPAGPEAELVAAGPEDEPLELSAGAELEAPEPGTLEVEAPAGPELEDAGAEEATPGAEVDDSEPGALEDSAGAVEDAPLPGAEDDSVGTPVGLEVLVPDSEASVTVEVPLRVEVTKTVLVEAPLPMLLLLPWPVTASPVVLLVPSVPVGGSTPLSAGPLKVGELMETDVRVRGQMVVPTATTEVVTGQSVTSGPQPVTV